MTSSGALETSNKYVKYRIDVTPGTGNVAGNYTPVTVSVVAYRTNTGYTTYGTGTIWCKINGTTYSAGITSNQKITNVGIELFRTTVNIPHNADGTKTLEVKASLSIPGAGLSSVEQGFSVALATIPRASTISSVVGNLFGQQIMVNIKRASESFTHQVWYKIGASEWFDLGTGYTTSCGFTVDMEKCKYIPNSTSDTLVLCVRTYSGTTRIGNDYYDYSYKIHVPESVVPEITAMTVVEAEDKIAEEFEVFVQNVSKLRIVTEADGGQGSTISSYSAEVLGVSYSGKEIETNKLTGSGVVAVRMTVKDSRGRSATMIKNVDVIEYTSPTISVFSVTRAKSDGTEDAEGEYASCHVKFDISPVAEKNIKSYKIEYSRTEPKNWITMKSGSVYSMDEDFISSSAVLSSDYAYTVRLTLTDYFTSVTAEVELGTGAPLMDFRGTGKGMSIGKVSEKDCFEVAMDAEFNRQVRLLQEDGTYVELLKTLKELNREVFMKGIVMVSTDDYVFTNGTGYGSTPVPFSKFDIFDESNGTLSFDKGANRIVVEGDISLIKVNYFFKIRKKVNDDYPVYILFYCNDSYSSRHPGAAYNGLDGSCISGSFYLRVKKGDVLSFGVGTGTGNQTITVCRDGCYGIEIIK